MTVAAVPPSAQEKKLSAGRRAIVMSGHRADAQVRGEVEAGRIRNLQIPFDIAAPAAEPDSAMEVAGPWENGEAGR